jgi:hypothetical protein
MFRKILLVVRLRQVGPDQLSPQFKNGNVMPSPMRYASHCPAKARNIMDMLLVLPIEYRKLLIISNLDERGVEPLSAAAYDSRLVDLDNLAHTPTSKFEPLNGFLWRR